MPHMAHAGTRLELHYVVAPYPLNQRCVIPSGAPRLSLLAPPRGRLSPNVGYADKSSINDTLIDVEVGCTRYQRYVLFLATMPPS